MLNYYTWTAALDNVSDLQIFLIQINWEDASFILETDFFFLFNLISDSFLMNVFSTTFVSYFSWLDDFYMTLFFNSILTLYDSIVYDFFLFCNTFGGHIYFQFLINNNDLLLYYTILDFDSIFFFSSFFSYLDTFYFYFNTVLFYDTFVGTLFVTYLDYIVYIKWFFIFVLYLFLLSTLLRFTRFSDSYNYFLTRSLVFFTALGFENRLQFDALVSFLIFVFFVWVVVLMTFDDVFTDNIDLIHMFLVNLFLFIIIFLLIKYSIHYFSFLENTVTEGFSVSFILKQMVRDLSNTFALFLRFFLLFFRMNIYDGLDDFLDSYYIFLSDFDENSFLDEDFVEVSQFFFISDNAEDLSISNPNEQEFLNDLWSEYAILWGKPFFFLFFFLEELFRISLALYIFYLIIFEVHAVNVSYFEDNFFFYKKEADLIKKN